MYNASSSNLEYGSHYPDAPKVFLTDVDFPSFWNGAERVFLVVPNTQSEDALKRLQGSSIWMMAAAGGKSLYSNQPGGSGRLTLGSGEIRSSSAGAP